MCLLVDTTKTKNFNPKVNKTLIFYKFFYIHTNEILSPYQNFSIKFNDTSIISTNDDLDITFSTTPSKTKIQEIESGCFHAYQHKHIIPNLQLLNTTLIPIQVKSFDIIAFGQFNDICFSKFKITKQTWSSLI